MLLRGGGEVLWEASWLMIGEVIEDVGQGKRMGEMERVQERRGGLEV